MVRFSTSLQRSQSLQDNDSQVSFHKKVQIFASLAITFLIGIEISLILYGITLPPKAVEHEDIIAFSAPANDVIEEPVTINEVSSAPPPPPASLSKIIASNLAAEISVPVIDFESAEISEFTENLDLHDDFGESWGATPSDSIPKKSLNWKALPASMSARCSKQQRLQQLKKSGGSAECDDAVLLALQWLKSTQNSDGSWSDRNQVGFTGLALLCYLGHCETPLAEEFGETVERAIIYLVDTALSNNGKMSADFSKNHWPYEHAIATYALAESFTLCKQAQLTIPNLQDVLVLATNHIVNQQHKSTGAWDYYYNSSGKRGGDSSIVCWHLQALKACKLTKIPELQNLNRTASKALKYLEKCQHRDGSIHYHPQGHQQGSNGLSTMTGAAMLCFQQWNKQRSTTVRKAHKFINKNVKFD